MKKFEFSRIYEKVEEDNPYHDEQGRFSIKERARNGQGTGNEGTQASGLPSGANSGADSPGAARTLSRNYGRGARSSGVLNGLDIE